MNGTNGHGGKKRPGNDVHRLDGAENLPVAPGAQGAVIVKEIIEQILANERRRARMEFLRLSLFFVLFLLLMFGSAAWFARQMLTQLREERALMEQSWRMATGVELPATAAREEPGRSAKAKGGGTLDAIGQKLMDATGLFAAGKDRSGDAVRDTIKSQKETIKALNARLSETHARVPMDEPPAARAPSFVSAPVAGDLELRMPIPSP